MHVVNNCINIHLIVLRVTFGLVKTITENKVKLQNPGKLNIDIFKGNSRAKHIFPNNIFLIELF